MTLSDSFHCFEQSMSHPGRCDKPVEKKKYISGGFLFVGNNALLYCFVAKARDIL